ncbi:unnamed protein product [Arabidopsis thaliana]|uniref:Uncharacterized protein n=1 Tax=Arabidopsis thaliana TaxID=3702 RepID=A0A5S9XIF0_ARATH|nr:unnamed protein product [Arabidopsis thaliana]
MSFRGNCEEEDEEEEEERRGKGREDRVVEIRAASNRRFLFVVDFVNVLPLPNVLYSSVSIYLP